MIEVIKTKGAPSPKGPYSQGIVTSGRTLYITGQASRDPNTQEFVPGTFEEQATLALECIQAIVEAAGGSLKDLVKVNVYVADPANYEKLNEVYERFISEPLPARTMFQANTLPGYEVMIDAIATLDH